MWQTSSDQSSYRVFLLWLLKVFSLNSEVRSVVVLRVRKAVCIQLGLSGSKRGVGTAIRVRGRQLGASKVGTCSEDILMRSISTGTCSVFLGNQCTIAIYTIVLSKDEQAIHQCTQITTIA